MAKTNNPLGIRRGSIIRALHRHGGDDANLTATVLWVRNGDLGAFWNNDGDVTPAGDYLYADVQYSLAALTPDDIVRI